MVSSPFCFTGSQRALDAHERSYCPVEIARPIKKIGLPLSEMPAAGSGAVNQHGDLGTSRRDRTPYPLLLYQ
jgi:hypothetical protein